MGSHLIHTVDFVADLSSPSFSLLPFHESDFILVLSGDIGGGSFEIRPHPIILDPLQVINPTNGALSDITMTTVGAYPLEFTSDEIHLVLASSTAPTLKAQLFVAFRQP